MLIPLGFLSLGAGNVYFINTTLLSGTGSNTLNSISTDSTNQKYVYGMTYYNNITSRPAVLVRNKNGVGQWARVLGTEDAYRMANATFDTAGNVYVNCEYRQSSANTSAFAKFDSSGNFLWAKRAGSNIGKRPIIGLSNGNIAVNSGSIVYVYNQSGTFIGGQNSTSFRIYAITKDSSDNIYATGDANNPFHGRLRKYNSSGTVLMQRMTSSGGNWSSVAADNSGNVYVTNDSASIVKINSSGAYVWSKKFSSTQISYDANHLAWSTDGFLYVFMRDVSIPQQSIIAKLDTDGNLIWQRSMNTGSSTSPTQYPGTITALPNGAFAVTLQARDNPGYGLTLVLPGDGTKTGSYTVGGLPITYAASSYTFGAGTAQTVSADSQTITNASDETTVTPTVATVTFSTDATQLL